MAKKLIKKFSCVKNTITLFFEEMEKKGIQGKQQPRFPQLWKKRFPIPSQNIGKRGGLRILSYHIEGTNEIRPAAIYFKGDDESLDDSILKEIVEQLS